MSETPPLPLPQATEQAPSQARRTALAFQSVFGQPIRRSADQRIVIEFLREACGRDRPIFQQDKVGNFDPLRAAHIDGAQTQYLIIKRQLTRARRLLEADKPKVKVKKGSKA